MTKLDFFGIIYISIMTIILLIIFLWNRNKNKLIEIKRLELELSYNPGDLKEDFLDVYITQIFDDYKNINLLDLTEYINDDDEQKIIADLVERVNSRISPIVYTKLKAYYNSEYLGEIIAEKITLLVAVYRISHNEHGKE